jgi:host factor-I protein
VADKTNNLQDIFLNHLRKTKTPVTMFLVKGVKLQGIITWFDNFSVLLRRTGSPSSYTSTLSPPSCPRNRWS